MDPLQFLVPLGWVDAIGEYLPFAIFVLIVVNAITRHQAHSSHKRNADDGDENVNRYPPHTVANVGLVILGLLYVVHHPHGGLIMTALILTMFIADIFEFEARQVEARNGLPIERPKSSLTAWGLAFLYAAYQAFFEFVAPFWELVV